MLDGDPSISHYQLYHDIVRDLASPAGIFRGARISSLPTKRREEIRAPLKMPAGEAIRDLALKESRDLQLL